MAITVWTEATGNDRLTVGTGNNTLSGGNGNDIFVFGPSFGKDTVTDFEHGDHIEFDGGVFANFSAVQAATHQVGADTVISLGTDHADHTAACQREQPVRKRLPVRMKEIKEDD